MKTYKERMRDQARAHSKELQGLHHALTTLSQFAVVPRMLENLGANLAIAGALAASYETGFHDGRANGFAMYTGKTCTFERVV